ncbi:PIN domain-like protein [Aspergillus steynii IBT 23096]|uniref:PIN domain-like protein n=1 Tax=Aspergillus steynii IBT 23096 TaxID=1392250 RepID=A0A2I2G378_9EURO|nr:PIN domain-like protein [Aspergillus steynii IBT 23096]PLB47328.1 PIN domain-like protein [Aspergillus steynii IBT 23096]
MPSKLPDYPPLEFINSPALLSTVRLLDEWAAPRTQSLPISALKGAVVGIDASHYISQHLLQPSTREPLLVALGGFPFALKTNIERELQTLKELGVGCLFVFNGLGFSTKDQRPAVQPESVRAFEQAWDLYDQQQADQVVDAFSGAGTPRPETLYRFLQRILRAHDIEYMVAPYSAAAQVRWHFLGPTVVSSDRDPSCPT